MQCAQVLVHRVLVAGKDMQGQVTRDARVVGGTPRDTIVLEQVHPGTDAQRKPAQRVIDVRAHFGAIAAQPVERRFYVIQARGETPAAGHHFGHDRAGSVTPAPGQLRLDQGREFQEAIDQHGAAQHGTIDSRPVLGDVLLRHQRTHAVPDQDQRHARIPLAHDGSCAVEIPHGAIPAVRIAEHTQLRTTARQAVSTMIGRVYGVTRRVERRRCSCISRSMLGCTVGEQNRAARILTRPDAHEDRHLVRCVRGKADYLHVGVPLVSDRDPRSCA
jgi:hypothetical protein